MQNFLPRSVMFGETPRTDSATRGVQRREMRRLQMRVEEFPVLPIFVEQKFRRIFPRNMASRN